MGINTAIYSPSGGSVGIGFAIPSNLAKPIIAELKEQGHIERGWLGVAIQDLSPDLSRGLGLGNTQGALVSSVQEKSPAAAAGFKAGDVVLAFGDHTIASPKDLSRAVAETASGAKVPVKIWRDGSAQTVNVTIAPLTEDVASAAAPTGSGDVGKGDTVEQLGATLAPVTDQTRQEFGLADDATGVVIADLDPDSALAEQGVRPGDIIERVNDREVADAGDVGSAIEAARKDHRDVAVLLIARDGNDRFVAVQISQS
jgi:serine protease Do